MGLPPRRKWTSKDAESIRIQVMSRILAQACYYSRLYLTLYHEPIRANSRIDATNLATPCRRGSLDTVLL